MSTFVRLVYASTCTSIPANIRDDLSDILNQCESFNESRDICGVLYYGSGYFFQCIEGPKSEVANLYEKLLKDPRHKEVNLLKLEDVHHRRFSHWCMKYVMHDAAVQAFFVNHHWETFYPYALDAHVIDRFLDLLLEQEAYKGFNRVITETVKEEPTESSMSAAIVILTAAVIALLVIVLYVLSQHFKWYAFFSKLF